MNTMNKEYFALRKEQGLKAGIVPVPTPPDEEKRLKELERLGILDKDFESDRRFNNITQIARYLTDCPFSVVNILGKDSQYCKLSSGIPIANLLLQQEIPRDVSICQYVLAAPEEQLIIENIDEDERTRNFKNMPGSSGIKFYAGSPLVSSQGYALGTLCVAALEPTTLNHSQKEALRLLSDQVTTLLEQDSRITDYDLEEKVDVLEPTEGWKGEYYSSATILFSDFVGFTRLVEEIQPGELLETLNRFFTGFDQIIAKHGLKKVKTIGDAYMCVGGVPEGRNSHPQDTCSAGIDLVRFVEGTNMQHRALGKSDWPIRVGIHTGPVIAGYSGGSFDVWGDTVNIAARMESSGEAGKVHISEMTRAFVEHSEKIVDRGMTDLKNKGPIHTYFIDG